MTPDDSSGAARLPAEPLPQQQPWAMTPSGAEAAPLYSYLLLVTPGRVSGRVSDFRDGTLTLDPGGVTLDGKAYYSTGKQVLVLLLSAFVGILIGALLLEHVLRDPKRLRLSWQDVDEVVFQPDKNKACLVYRDPSRPDRRLSLAFKLMPSYYQNFAAAARYFAPGKVREGKIGGPTPWWAVLVLIVFFLLIIAAIVFAGGS